jgi:peptidoglycan-associated lipoprotein
MFKKFMCLMAVLVLITACESTEMNEGAGSGHGMHGTDIGNAPGNAEGLTQIGDRVFFDFDKSEINGEGRETLDRQALWMKKYPAIKVIVEGHCDERGTREYNIALGERRAMAVKNYLVAEGVKAKRIKTVSYGKERPAALGHDEEAWAQNRRGVTIIAD